MRPSPARVEAPEPDVWIPILDVAALEALQTRIDPALVRELHELEYRFLDREATASPVVPAVLRGLPGVELVEPEVTEAAPEPAPAPELQPVVVREATEDPVAVAATHRRHRILHFVILGVALAVVAAGIPYFLHAPAQRRVTLTVDGASSTHTTRADTVSALLAAAGVTVAPGDRISPKPGATLGDGTTVEVVRAVPVTVDVDGQLKSVLTTARTVTALGRQLGIPAGMVAVGASRITRGATIAFRTPHDLTLIIDGVPGALTSTARTVGELLTERAVAVAAGDEVDPAPATPITGGMKIAITRTTAGRVTEDTPVPYPTTERSDPSLPVGQRQVAQPGVAGIDRTTFQVTKSGDTVVGKQPLGTVRMQAPQPEIVAVGTKPATGAAQQSGIATWYATLYQPGTCAHLSIPFGTIVTVVDTATGRSTTCRVADRGPEAWTGNIIDLSPDVFRQLAPLSSGKLSVRLEY